MSATLGPLFANAGRRFGPHPAITSQGRQRTFSEVVDQGWRLCCLARVYGDVVVRVPEGGFAYPPELQRSGGG